MDSLRIWITGIVYTAAAGAVLMALLPRGRVRDTARMALGALLLLAALRLPGRVSYELEALKTGFSEERWRNTGQEYQKQLIQAGLVAYIEAQARDSGLELTGIEVELGVDFLPVFAKIKFGDGGDENDRAELIARLGIGLGCEVGQ